MLRSYQWRTCICLRICVAQEGLQIVEATGCGGIVIFHGKVLLLHKNYRSRCEGWVPPKDAVEAGESFKTAAPREAKEETGVSAHVVGYIGKNEYTFNVQTEQVDKSIHWYLMSAGSYYSKPQRKKFSMDSDCHRYYGAWYLLKFANEKAIFEKAYAHYQERKQDHISGSD